jgi:hypothetical protein
MRLNTGIITHALPFTPDFVCGHPDHALALNDVRFLPAEKSLYSEDILYFAEWEKLRSHKSPVPPYLFCVGGGADAAAFFKKNDMTGAVCPDEDPISVFSILQSIFLRFNQLENSLLSAIHAKAPMREILNCCSEFFQNHTMLFDSERNLLDYSANYLPDASDLYWKETLEHGRRTEKVLSEARKHVYYLDAIRTPTSDFMDLGPGLPKIMTYSFYEGGKRLTTLTVAETNKPLSVYQLRLFDYLAGLLSPGLFHIYSVQLGLLESLRSVLLSLLNKEIADPLVVTRCVGMAGWGVADDYLLILISFPEASRSSETLMRYRHIYERFFPECVAFQFNGNLVLLVHNDTDEVLAACLPNLEKQLATHNAFCGLSFPFKGVLQVQAQYMNAETALHFGDAGRRIRLLSEAITVPIISRIAEGIPLYPLCHREAIRIFEYDRENGTELLLTLETYLLQYKSLKAAAEQLYIHRNTMTYRLGCIDKIASLALDDPRQRLHLLLSCIILRTLGPQKAS